MAATHDAKDEPEFSARSHMVRKPSTTPAPAGDAAWSATTRGSKGNAMAATKRLALPSK